MSIDNIDARDQDGQIEIGLFEGEDCRQVVPLSLDSAMALRDALDIAIAGVTEGLLIALRQARDVCKDVGRKGRSGAMFSADEAVNLILEAIPPVIEKASKPDLVPIAEEDWS